MSFKILNNFIVAYLGAGIQEVEKALALVALMEKIHVVAETVVGRIHARGEAPVGRVHMADEAWMAGRVHVVDGVMAVGR